MNAIDVIHAMPTAFVATNADDVSATVQFNISSPAYVTIDNGNCTVNDGSCDDALVTLTIEDADLVDLLNGDLDGVTAFMTGKLQVEGDLMFAQRFISFFDRSKVS